ncbi:MAG: TIGR04283 family arsenosugar biosynthesis glycosyltransferase [Cyclobacteriaceae bacterium]
MQISVIIPTFNEDQNIGQLVDFILVHGQGIVSEVIVVDGNSTDSTVEVAVEAGARVLRCATKSRAAQMNLGASEATGHILYFVHADIKLVDSFVTDISEALNSGFDAGCYRYKFDSKKSILKFNAYFTRFNRIMCRGGDQTLFIKRNVFEALGRFNERFVIMEDYDLIRRIQKRYKFRIIPKSILVSDRKYHSNSWLRVQLANLTIFMMYLSGVSPQKMARYYKKLLDYR